MTFGEGVEDSEALPQQFANLTAGTYRVVNPGVPGYGPQAMLRTLETGFRDDLAKADRLRASLIRDKIAKVEAIKQDRH